MIIWLVGLSGSGKSTIGKRLYDEIKEKEKATVFIDGDEIRELFKHDKYKYDYTIEARKTNGERIKQICYLLDKNRINVVACVLSIFPEILRWNRKKYSKYYEIFVDIGIEELSIRDTKGLYKKAFDKKIKNVVGVDIDFPRPINTDLIIDIKDQKEGVEYCVKKIFNHLKLNTKI